MTEILTFGIQVVVFVQSLGDWLLQPMMLFSLSGSVVFYLLIALWLYWCISTAAGLKIGLFLLFSEGINDILKVVCHAPRPYWYSTEVKALATETTFGLPSGHAQHAVVVWSTLTAWSKNRRFWITALTFVFLIGLSRLYLGVHFPTDVLAGWGVGIPLVWSLLRYERRFSDWFLNRKINVQLLLALLISLCFLGSGFMAKYSVGDWQMPQEWEENATRSGGEVPEPGDITNLIISTGAFFGLLTGAIILHQRGGFEAGKGTAWQMAARYLLGISGAVILWTISGAIYPYRVSTQPYSLIFLQYTLVGIWLTGLAPLVFIRLGLAEPNHNR